ncbi:MAG: ABC transporter substrate-binding protein [Actinobacteria bacterium]|nr:ABC transporter substrate-binding protein [Actinomycetota bacterium]
MRSDARLVLRGYAPLLVMAALFIALVGFVPTVSVEVGPETVVAGGPGGGAPGQVVAGPAGSDGTGAAAAGNERVGSSAGTQRATTVGGGQVASGSVGACSGRARQVPGDPYSPPCVEWTGTNNGGSTSRGVTSDAVTVSFRVIDEKGFMQTLATLAGAEIIDTPADIRRTVEALVGFFNDHYEMYGRKIKTAFFDGTGSSSTELLGGGRAEAVADAAQVADEIGAFIEMNGSTEPFADALTRGNGVIAFGSPYLSRKWHLDRAPLAWSIATDCSIVAEAAAELAIKTLAGKPALFAGGNLQGKTRKLAGMSPENAWYQECHDDSIRKLEEAGLDPGIKVNYKLDINSMSNQAASVIAQLKDGGATTVLLGIDPIFPVFFTAKAEEQNYQPEWVPVGTALSDWDVSGQLYDQDQWSHAFGISSLGEPTPIRAGLGYSAYKSVRADEPAFTVEQIYGTLLLIATGIQMAGPSLTPQTFATGLKSWPGGTGPFGTWGFGPNDYTPTRDYRVIWWDPKGVSVVNSQPGRYVSAYGGKRFPTGQFPSGDLQVFE